MLKKLLSLLLVAVMVLSLAACGVAPAGEQGNTPADTQEAEGEKEA